MKKKSSKKTVITTVVDTYEVCENINLRVIYQNGKLVSQELYFVKKPLGLPKDSYPHIIYVKDSKAFKEEAKSRYFHSCGDKVWWWTKHEVKDLLDTLSEKINSNNVFIILSYDNTIRDRFGEPIDILVKSDYIDGFCNRVNRSKPIWKWDKLVEHLKKRKDIFNLKEEEVPYYNSDFCGQKGLSFDYVRKASWYKITENNYVIKRLILGETNGVDPFKVSKFRNK